MLNKSWKEIVTELIDNDTMIILGILILAGFHPQYAKEVIIGLIGFLGGKKLK